MRLLKTSLIFLLTTAVAFAGGTTTDWVKLRINANQRIEFQGASGKTELVAATPTGSNVVTFQDASGTVALLDDVAGVIFGPTGTLFADAANTGDPSEDGSIQHPFDLGQEAIDASSVNNLIVFAPGTYAENLVFPHDLHVDGHGVKGLLSINISSGAPDGMLGDIEYHSTGAIIHGGTNAIANGNLAIFAGLVGGTQSNPYSLGLIPGTYDLGTQQFKFDDDGQSVLSIYGAGIEPPELISTITILASFAGNQSFQNLRLTVPLVGTYALQGKSGQTITGIFKDIYSNGRIGLSTDAAFDGIADNIDTDGQIMFGGSGITHNGVLTNLKARDAQGVEISGNTSTSFVCEVIQGGVQLSGSMTSGAGHIFMADGADLSAKAGTIVTGKIVGQKITEVIPAGDWTIPVSGIDSATYLISAGKVCKSGSIIEDSKGQRLARSGSAFEAGVIFRRLSLTESTAVNQLGASIDNKATFIDLDHNTVDTGSTGFAVSSGAKIYDSAFRGRAGLANEFAPNVIGRDLLAEWGFASGTYSYLAASNELVFHLSTQPGGAVLISTGTTFDAILRKTDAGFSGAKGEIYEFTVIQDGANTFGFGVNEWVLHTTATDSARLDADLGVPGSDIVSTSRPEQAMIGIAATITVDSATTFEGKPFGNEITLTDDSTGTKIVTLTADDTIISMSGFKILRLDSDNVTATDRTFSFDPSSLLAGGTYTVYFIDATNAAEWIDGGVDSAKLSATMTFGEDDTIQFIYDGTTIRELSRSAN